MQPQEDPGVGIDVPLDFFPDKEKKEGCPMTSKWISGNHHFHEEHWTFKLLRTVRREIHFKHADSENGKLSLFVKIFYGAPTLVHQAGAALMIQLYVLTFYEDLGMSLSTQAAILAVARSIDVVSDPTMSYITDNLSSKHGRRRPFMVTGCWFYALALFALMSPPSEGVDVTLWFGVFYVVFYLCSTYCAIPYDALGPELTDNYDDRNQLFLFSNLFSMCGMLVGAGLPLFFMGTSNTDYLQQCSPLGASEYGGRNVSAFCPDSSFSSSGVGASAGWNVDADIFSHDISSNKSTTRSANASDFQALDFSSDCKATQRGPDYPASFPDAFCHCANQCYADDELSLSRSANSWAAGSLGFYYW